MDRCFVIALTTPDALTVLTDSIRVERNFDVHKEEGRRLHQNAARRRTLHEPGPMPGAGRLLTRCGNPGPRHGRRESARRTARAHRARILGRQPSADARQRPSRAHPGSAPTGLIVSPAPLRVVNSDDARPAGTRGWSWLPARSRRAAAPAASLPFDRSRHVVSVDPALDRPTRCAFCRSEKITANNQKVTAGTYWRCESCGQLWNPERQRANAGVRSDTRGGFADSRSQYAPVWPNADDRHKR